MNASQQPVKNVDIDFMYIDLDVCTRCKGTDANLETALNTVQDVLKSAGAKVTVRKTLIDSEAKVMQHSFISSPTIRVNGRDIALELKESSCASCGEACGCEGEIDCRVWVYGGQEHTVAPVSMIVDSILKSVYGTTEDVPIPRRPPAVPENLKRFFDAKAAKAASACCGAEEQAVCCEPSQKSSCCAPPSESAEPASCGCR